MMLRTKYQGSRPCAFRQDFFTFLLYKPMKNSRQIKNKQKLKYKNVIMYHNHLNTFIYFCSSKKCLILLQWPCPEKPEYIMTVKYYFIRFQWKGVFV